MGRPVELGIEGEVELMRRINLFLESFSHITGDLIVREAVDLAAVRRRGEIDDEKALQRLQHVGGPEWYVRCLWSTGLHGVLVVVCHVVENEGTRCRIS